MHKKTPGRSSPLCSSDCLHQFWHGSAHSVLSDTLGGSEHSAVFKWLADNALWLQGYTPLLLAVLQSDLSKVKQVLSAAANHADLMQMLTSQVSRHSSHVFMHCTISSSVVCLKTLSHPFSC